MPGESSIQAMRALAAAQQVTANNLANANTDGFEPSRVRMEDGPGGEGVAVSAIEKAAPAAPTARREAGLPVAGELPPSGTDVAREMVDMVKHSRSFEANAVFFRNLHETLGLLTDLKA